MDLPVFSFYLPESSRQDIASSRRGKSYWTAWIWAQQPYEYLQERGFPCRIVHYLPSEGIVLAHRRDLPNDFRPTEKLFLVSLQGDFPWHAYSNVDIVQNPTQVVKSSGKNRYYIPHYTERALIPRRPSQGDRFERVGYFGIKDNLAPELASDEFLRWTKDHGFDFRIVADSREWADYSQVDAVLAVRSFNGNPYDTKPATKLFQTWLAGVPGIFNPESCNSHHRRSSLDFLEVRNMEETKGALLKLRDDLPFRRAMCENGLTRGPEFAPPATTDKWRELLEGPIAEDSRRWFGASRATKRFFLMRRQFMTGGKVLAKRVVPTSFHDSLGSLRRRWGRLSA